MGFLNTSHGSGNQVRVELFSSHSWSHDYRREGLHRLLEPDWKKGADFWDHSVTSDHPIHGLNTESDLFLALRNLISGCDVLLVFAGMEAAYSVWMEREVYIAKALGVPIVAVIPSSQKRRATLAMNFADTVAHWQRRTLARAILDHLPAAKRRAFESKLRLRELAAHAAESACLAMFDAPKPQAKTTLLTNGLNGPQPPSNGLSARVGSLQGGSNPFGIAPVHRRIFD